MDKKELKKLIALVFIQGYKKFPDVTNKTELAEKIVSDPFFKNNPLSRKSLVNYFNHFFCNGSEVANPNPNTLENLLGFIGFQSKEQFIANQPLDESYLNNVPFSKIQGGSIETKPKEISLIDENNFSETDSLEAKQTNVLSAFNSSKIKKIGGKIGQLNILGFGNKQEVDNHNDQIEK